MDGRIFLDKTPECDIMKEQENRETDAAMRHQSFPKLFPERPGSVRAF
jgi:hypothetical protein